jgi:hypothetical protein
MNDIEQLLNSTIPLVEDLLKKYGEFFPLASAVKTDGSIVQVGTYDGDEKPLSDKLIADFKTAFKAKQDDYRTVMIFYDVRVVNPQSEQKVDAIAVFVETKYDNDAYTFYFSYSLTSDKELEFSNSWKSLKEKEIFDE